MFVHRISVQSGLAFSSVPGSKRLIAKNPAILTEAQSLVYMRLLLRNILITRVLLGFVLLVMTGCLAVGIFGY